MKPSGSQALSWPFGLRVLRSNWFCDLMPVRSDQRPVNSEPFAMRVLEGNTVKTLATHSPRSRKARVTFGRNPARAIS